MKKYRKLLAKNTQTLYTYTTPKKNMNYFGDGTNNGGGDATTTATTLTTTHVFAI